MAAAAHAEVGADDFNLQNRSIATASSLTRAQMQAESERALAAGEIQYGETGNVTVINQQAGSARDVGEVRAEAIEAARKHPHDAV